MLQFALQHEIIVLIMFLSLLGSLEYAWALYLHRAYAAPHENEEYDDKEEDDE